MNLKFEHEATEAKMYQNVALAPIALACLTGQHQTNEGQNREFIFKI